LYLILRKRIEQTSIKPIEFATIIGSACKKIPYSSHKNDPIAITEYINKEISAVFFVLIILIAWGKNAEVVNTAAINPVIVI